MNKEHGDGGRKKSLLLAKRKGPLRAVGLPVKWTRYDGTMTYVVWCEVGRKMRAA